jgi:hypothetical protein
MINIRRFFLKLLESIKISRRAGMLTSKGNQPTTLENSFENSSTIQCHII